MALIGLLLFPFGSSLLRAQALTGTITTYANTDCDGRGCEYSGPTILINEIMLMPSTGDGSIAGVAYNASGSQKGEWIELYNPHKCESADISCYFLGNNAFDYANLADNGTNYPGGFSIPPGTVVPPQGFAIIRGMNAAAVPSNLLVSNGGNVVEVVVNNRYCLGGGNRLWFPNAGGWFAFYDQNGIPQDAISWTSPDNSSCYSCPPCVPSTSDCGYNGQLAAYNQIPADRKTQISTGLPTENRSFRRVPDGGNWVINQSSTPTYGTCNTTCVDPPIITCAGSAVIHVSGGTPPYTYLWSDTLHQTTDSATQLCEGDYSVLVRDAAGQTLTLQCHISNFVHTVTHPDIQLCQSQLPFTLTNQGSPAGGVYESNWINNLSINNPGELGTTTATYSYTDTNNCSGSTQFNITISDAVEASDSLTLCSYELPYRVASADTIIGRNAPEHLTLNCKLQNQSGCDSNVTLQVRIIDSHLSIITPSDDYCTDFMMELQAISPFNNYTWNNGAIGSNITVTSPGTYTVTATYEKCTAVESYTVPPCELNLLLPNAITPSKPDGINDWFQIPEKSQSQIKTFTIFIYNRWGQCVFTSKDKNFRWNGDYNGRILPNELYNYKIICTDYDNTEHTFTGNIIIL